MGFFGLFLRMPVFVFGMLSSAIGFGLISYIMAVAPLQVMNVVKLGSSANATIIKRHVVSMYGPSFFTDHLIASFGAPCIFWTGLFADVATIIKRSTQLGFGPANGLLRLSDSGEAFCILKVVR